MLYETQGATAADAGKARVRQALLTGPILRTLLKLGWPTIVVLVVQTLVGVAETYWVSFLGTAALAGVALFPVSVLPAQALQSAFITHLRSLRFFVTWSRAVRSGPEKSADRTAPFP